VLKGCLGAAPWHLGGRFIALRDLGAVGAPFGRPWLPYVHRIICVSFLPWQSRPLSTVGHLAHRTVQWSLVTVGWANVVDTDCATDCWPRHTAVTTDSPVSTDRKPRAACFAKLSQTSFLQFGST
jgi:hypothetical protein